MCVVCMGGRYRLPIPRYPPHLPAIPRHSSLSHPVMDAVVSQGVLRGRVSLFLCVMEAYVIIRVLTTTDTCDDGCWSLYTLSPLPGYPPWVSPVSPCPMPCPPPVPPSPVLMCLLSDTAIMRCELPARDNADSGARLIARCLC